MERFLLLALGMLIYGTLHGLTIAYISRVSPKALPLIRLLTAPVGVGIGLLASVPYIGWESARIAVTFLAIGAAPVLLILGYAAINTLRGEEL
jgi:hypothetical protein